MYLQVHQRGNNSLFYGWNTSTSFFNFSFLLQLNTAHSLLVCDEIQIFTICRSTDDVENYFILAFDFLANEPPNAPYLTTDSHSINLESSEDPYEEASEKSDEECHEESDEESYEN